MKSSFLRCAGAALLPLTLAACMSGTPYVDKNLGMAATDLRNAQIMNPGADRNMAPPLGLDGPAAKAGYDQYVKSFKAPEKNTSSFLIGVGR
ncbi:hypothetical protein SAMN05518865_106102 [Duganella sp. CF458]|uniref:hypothetical protein n=1 Tax=Duganella sp. CF458 TaxID=1884368 RepID=UPI0008DF3510|nr:hypothetical protein [Duganella sp. CF458]SFF92710.1 hypothetical protein SAMN05518865_106102 [Duganella sp. CF458]